MICIFKWKIKFITMSTITNNKKDISDNQNIHPLKRVTTVDKKMNQMRETLKKYPVPLELLEK
ncbi:hypothetical protein Dfri01_40310 [Dyadobacter frigoris]|nr:hypothetical protein Dfri01_40310 [Dyadobacter frigoris]